MPRRSMFRDAASIAGGVTVGTTVGHLAGEAITGLFGGGRRYSEVQQAVPKDYRMGSDPSGPCAYEIAQFLQCASLAEDLGQCQPYKDSLLECKRRNRIP
ncbi:coiled-coil-helix-coiled-coil-helix domain-containing protein 10, mitochondrial-like [Pectinophora gossypiella]|uniref:coiled-coil-helix-coiled-coil-helix domain-containing protein 10, mitochondrial-like n=1 Tax=Pectinophora gossypiella TaxID=13191 RepID=UPI00214EA1F9|nr:coiled-coil-helix-coiled-coil-helix domain-containing protein 10, mitochondrial-like [Pectinophora gossypiella]